jgi:peptidoglycan/xylan/chitin deacetylase (PgdA/CDA1 family)
MRQPIKRLLGQTLFAAGLDRLLLRNTAVVVAFHRVQDIGQTEGLTVSVSMFERYCRFFGQHFRVVSLLDLVERLERRQTLNRELAITFDDGYRDNYENAAPVLEKLSLPATFFIVTRWMGSDVIPLWNRVAKVSYPWMNWEQVRSLHRRGFDIGAHTRTHVDLGRVEESQAREEIVGARRELERQLEAPVQLFAYPYGRQDNLADSSREIVRDAGFRCCCSCFGGVIAQGTDPFHLARVPITQRLPSPRQFWLEVALGAQRRSRVASNRE